MKYFKKWICKHYFKAAVGVGAVVTVSLFWFQEPKSVEDMEDTVFHDIVMTYVAIHKNIVKQAMQEDRELNDSPPSP